MKVAVIGSTGKLGLQFVRQALDAGHEVVALCRSPDKITITNDKLSVKKCNIFKRESVKESVEGCDAVASFLGMGGKGSCCCGDDTAMKEVTEIIVAGMKDAGVTRLMITSTYYAPPDSRCACNICWCPPSMDCCMQCVMVCLLKCNILNMNGIFNGLYQTEQVCIANTEWLNYTAVRAPCLDGSYKDDEQFLDKQIYGIADVPSVGIGYNSMGRGDVARFFVENLEKKERQVVTIGYEECVKASGHKMENSM